MTRAYRGEERGKAAMEKLRVEALEKSVTELSAIFSSFARSNTRSVPSFPMWAKAL